MSVVTCECNVLTAVKEVEEMCTVVPVECVCTVCDTYDAAVYMSLMTTA